MEVSLTDGYTQIQTIQEWKVNIFTSHSRTTQRELTAILGDKKHYSGLRKGQASDEKSCSAF